jgi:hypothetical protein
VNGRHLESLRLFIHKFPVLGEGEIDGTVASLFTTVPYSIARTDSILPDSTITIYLAIVRRRDPDPNRQPRRRPTGDPNPDGRRSRGLTVPS